MWPLTYCSTECWLTPLSVPQWAETVWTGCDTSKQDRKGRTLSPNSVSAPLHTHRWCSACSPYLLSEIEIVCLLSDWWFHCCYLPICTSVWLSSNTLLHLAALLSQETIVNHVFSCKTMVYMALCMLNNLWNLFFHSLCHFKKCMKILKDKISWNSWRHNVFIPTLVMDECSQHALLPSLGKCSYLTLYQMRISVLTAGKTQKGLFSLSVPNGKSLVILRFFFRVSGM